MNVQKPQIDQQSVSEVAPSPQLRQNLRVEIDANVSAQAEAAALAAAQQGHTEAELCCLNTGMYLERGEEELAMIEARKAAKRIEMRSESEIMGLTIEYFRDNPMSELPNDSDVDFYTQGAHGVIRKNGITRRVSGNNEVDKMQKEIIPALEATAGLDPAVITELPKGRKKGLAHSYLEIKGDGTMGLNVGLISHHIAWLSDRKRILRANPDAEGYDGPSRSEAVQKRDAYFRAYRDYLVNLRATILTPSELMDYENRNGDDTGMRDFLQEHCRTGSADAVRGSAKFALVLAVGALLTLWVVKDFRNKTLSLGTLILIGSMLFLMQGASKHAFIASKGFEDLTGKDGPLKKNEADELFALKKGNSAAYGHLKDFMKEFTPQGSFTQEDVDFYLNNAKKHDGKPHEDKQEAGKIAQKYIGQSPGAVLKVLQGIQKYKGKDMEMLKDRIQDRENGVNIREEVQLAYGQSTEVQEAAKKAAKEAGAA